MPTYQTIAYFNQHSDDARDHRRDRFAGGTTQRGYRQGDPLKVSEYFRWLDFDAKDFDTAAEIVFSAMNRDGRPNGKSERSLSVGDVVYLIDHETGDEVWLAVAGVGFTRITTPNQFRPTMYVVK